jgi:hypothetical protein
VLASGAHAGGSFTSSDPLVNRIWAVSAKTARDRCPYIGDISVIGDLGLARQVRPSLLKLLDVWYPPQPHTTTVTVGAGSHWLLIDR